MIYRAALSILLGLVTTYGLAVVPPNRSPGPSGFRYTDIKSAGTDDADGLAAIRLRTRWRDTYCKSFYSDPVMGRVARVPPPSECRRLLLEESYQQPMVGRCGTGMPRLSTFQFEEWGWPMRCTWSWTRAGGPGPSSGKSFTVGENSSSGTPPSLKLPYGVAWLGLAANTAIFAPPWALLLFGPRALHLVRRRRGCCRACGYDLRGLPADAPCPECGTILDFHLGGL